MFIFWLILIFAAVFLCSVIRRHFSTSTHNKTLYVPALCVPCVVPFRGTPQRLNLQPSGEQRPQRPQHNKKNKTKKYLGTHTRRPCGGYWVAPRLLRIGRNERDTTGTQQNTGNRYLTVIYSSFNRQLCHAIPPVFNCWFAVAVPLLCRCSNGRQLPFIRPLISR